MKRIRWDQSRTPEKSTPGELVRRSDYRAPREPKKIMGSARTGSGNSRTRKASKAACSGLVGVSGSLEQEKGGVSVVSRERGPIKHLGHSRVEREPQLRVVEISAGKAMPAEDNHIRSCRYGCSASRCDCQRHRSIGCK